MTIDGINFNKLPRKNDVKLNKEVKQQQSVAPEMSEAEKVALQKTRDKALTTYFLATMALAGGAAMTSCQKQVVDLPLEQITGNQQQMIDLLKQILNVQNAQVANQESMLEYLKTMSSDNKELIKLVGDLIEQNKSISVLISGIGTDVANIATTNSKIVELLEKSNDNDEEFKAKLDAILASNLSDAEKLEAILQANKEQNDTLINLLNLIQGTEENEGLSDIIKNFYNDYKAGDATKSEMMEGILNAILENNSISSDIKAQIEKLASQGLSDSQLLAKMAELLAGIKEDTGAIREDIAKIAEDVSNLTAKLDANQTAIVDGLAALADSVGGVSSKLDQIMEKQDAGNATLVEISDKMDQAIAKLDGIDSKIITKEEAEEMLGDLIGDIDFQGGSITKEELKELMEQYKTDLTRTNSLLETIVGIVSNLDTNGESGLLAEVLDAIKTGNGNLESILDKVSSMDGSLTALVQTGDQIVANQDKFMDGAKNYGDKFLAELSKIGSKMIDEDVLAVYAESYKEYLVKAEQARQEQYNITKAIFNNMGTSTGGGEVKVDMSEVIDAIKDLNIPNISDYTTLLEEIRDNLGNVITSSDLENFFVKTQPDLTRTNSLIETLVGLVSNMDFSSVGGGSVNTSTIESLISEIKTAIANNQVASEQQMQALIDAVKALQSSGSGSESRGTYYHSDWQY